MPANDALLFIDANEYLDLYNIVKGKQLLAALTEQANHIFVTQQVVDEVKRNSLGVAVDFLNRQIRELQITERTYAIPDHLFGVNPAQSDGIKKQMKEIAEKISAVNQEAKTLALGIIEQVARSEDEVSKALAPIFARSIAHTPAELEKAKERKERGNPPGKHGDPIGDELSWEQILSHFTSKKRLWIISKDGDFGTIYMNKGFIKPVLLEELNKLSPSSQIYLFADVYDGIKHFAEQTGTPAVKLPTPEEAKEIKKEIEQLPNVDWMPSGIPIPRSAWEQNRIAVFHSLYGASGVAPCGIGESWKSSFTGPLIEKPDISIFRDKPSPIGDIPQFREQPSPIGVSSMFKKPVDGPVDVISSQFHKPPFGVDDTPLIKKQIEQEPPVIKKAVEQEPPAPVIKKPDEETKKSD